MSVNILGIRHHGPGCARSVVDALDARPPALLLVEGPPDADESIAQAALAGMSPPVALLIHRTDDPRQSVFYPFAEFSPEWQAIRWALSHGVPVKFMDFPWLHRFAIRDDAGKVVEGDSQPAEATQSEPGDEDIRRDPLKVLAEADGYSDSERWWNDRVEERGDASGMFSAILEAMTAVRTELAIPESREELQREAWMRRVIRESQREVLGEIAVVCGAWHAPVLAQPPKVSADNDLLKGLPKCKVAATWVPWTYRRLSFMSGYGAGITSPGWYEHLWQHRRDPMLGARWLSRVGHLLRGRDLDASTAQVIDGVRLAEHLAAFRGRAIPGLPEMNEATRAVLCHGDAAPLQLIHQELIVGTKLGEVPEGISRVPLQEDIESTQRRLRLKPSAAQTNLELDLRETGGLERSQFLHRLSLLDVPWGQSQTARGKGTFKELWRLEWKPEFVVAIIDGARFGNTVESAAAGAIAHKAATAELEGLCVLLEKALLADLPAATSALLQRISAEAARGDDVMRLARAAPAMARLARYGNVRQTDTNEVVRILDGFCARIHVGLPGAVAGIDDDAAASWHEAVREYHAALNLLESSWIADWRVVLAKLLNSTSTHALLAGACARMLFEAGQLTPEEAARVLGLALSRGEDPSRAAAWIEGFLSGQGAVLVHDPNLLPLLEGWVAGMTNDAFLAVLPLVRRTFSTFTAPERAKVAGRLGKPQRVKATVDEGWNLDEARVRAVLPAVALLLGRQVTPDPSPSSHNERA